MKRKIAYIFTTAVISLAAFSIGKFTSESDTPDQKTTKTTTVETETAQEIKSIETFTENETPKTKMIINDNNTEKEIILEGNGKLKIAAVEA